MRLVVVDAQDARAAPAVPVEERREAGGIEALLDDRGAQAADPRVVAVVDGEHRACAR